MNQGTLLLANDTYQKMFNMKIAVLLSLAVASTIVEAFSSRAACTDKLFWGTPRTKSEIVNFVSDAVFTEEHEVDREEQWVEVISAEPPVSRSDFSSTFQYSIY